MRVIIHPVLDPEREVDLTHQMVAAIAEELWRLFGGDGQLNWIEAESHLQKIIDQARSESRRTAMVSVPSSASMDDDMMASTQEFDRVEHWEPLVSDHTIL